MKMVIGKRDGSDDEPGIERVPDPDFARLPDDYGEWDEDEMWRRTHGMHVYGKVHPDPEDVEHLLSLAAYIDARTNQGVIGRRVDLPLPAMPKWWADRQAVVRLPGDFAGTDGNDPA